MAKKKTTVVAVVVKADAIVVVAAATATAIVIVPTSPWTSLQHLTRKRALSVSHGRNSPLKPMRARTPHRCRLPKVIDQAGVHTTSVAVNRVSVSVATAKT